MGNIFIAVIGNAYSQVLEGTEDRWNDAINELMFKQFWMRLSRAQLKQLHHTAASNADEKAYLTKRLAHSKTADEMEMPGMLRALLQALGYCCGLEIHTFPLPYRTKPVDASDMGEAADPKEDSSVIDAVWRWRTVIRPAERLFQFDWARLPEAEPAVLEDALKSAQTRRRDRKDALVQSIAARLKRLEEQDIATKLKGLEQRYGVWFLSQTTEEALSSSPGKAHM
jgi:hypothetical protein